MNDPEIKEHLSDQMVRGINAAFEMTCPHRFRYNLRLNELLSPHDPAVNPGCSTTLVTEREVP